MSEYRKLFVVDDHPLARAGIAALLESQSDLVVCGEAEGPEQALAQIPTCQPDLILVDLSLREGSGFELLQELRRRHPELPALVVSMHNERTHGEKALQLGARGYVMKTEAPDVLIEAIRAVLSGRLHFSDSVRDAVVQHAAEGRGAVARNPAGVLTEREMEIYRLIGEGLTMQEIADRLSLSRKTVNAHRDSIRKKLHLANSQQLACSAATYLQHP